MKQNMKKMFFAAFFTLFAAVTASAGVPLSAEVSAGPEASGMNPVRTLYQKYENNPNVSTVYISKAMFDLLGILNVDSASANVSIDGFTVEDMDVASAFKVLSTLKGLYILSTEDPSTAKAIRKEIDVAGSYDELMKVKDGEDRADFYYKSADGVHVSEFIMLAYSKDETVVIQFEADGLTFEDVARRASVMAKGQSGE